MCFTDFFQENQGETRDEWAERLWREASKPRHYADGLPRIGRKKRQHPARDSQNDPGPSTSKKAAIDEEELRKARARMQEAYRLQAEQEKKNQHKKRRTEYEVRYQKTLAEENGRTLGYDDVPWPSKGSMNSIIDVLFCDLGITCTTALKKYVRQQQVRWHPDKFRQRFGERLEEGSKEKVLERVKQISQAINNRAETIVPDS